MLSFIINNYILIILLVGFVIMLRSSLRTFDARKHKRISELLIVIIALVISGAFKIYFSKLDYYTVGSVVTYYIGYILRPAVIILFVSILTDKKYVKYLSLLCVVNTTIYTIGLFNGMTFTFNESNEIVRNLFCYSSHVLCFIYFLLVLSTAIKQHSKQNKMKTVVLITIMITCALASLFDVLYEDVNLFDLILLICGLEYYLFLYLESNKIDVLTNTFNRASFYSDIKRLGNKVSSVVSIDMNDLKKINDEQGHDEGDKAIYTMAKVLLNVDDNNVRIYRVGGDEFVALCFYKNKEDVTEFVKKAKKDLSKTKYHCSFGYAYMDGNDLFEVYKKADDEMYKDKEEYHKKNGRYR